MGIYPQSDKTKSINQIGLRGKVKVNACPCLSCECIPMSVHGLLKTRPYMSHLRGQN